MRVLVTDGDNRAALAVTRSLGRAGHEVIVGAPQGWSLAQASRYCVARATYPDPVAEPDRFLEAAVELVAVHRADCIIPVADVTTFIVTSNRHRFEPNCAVPFADAAAIGRAADKIDILETAKRIGIPVPRSIVVKHADQIPNHTIPFPLVIKPWRSRIRTEQGWASTSVSHAATPMALQRDLHGRAAHEFPVMLQERIDGPGAGVFACYRNGRPEALFSHRRLRERPPWGGVSVLSESVELPAGMSDFATRLLESIGWRGVAMVEFKIDCRDNQPKLMEVNGRFWGSLQLAIDSGVNFPLMLIDEKAATRDAAPASYRRGVRSRWLWGDFDALLQTMFRWTGPSELRPSRSRAIWQFLKFVGPELNYDNPKWDDLWPFVVETGQRFGVVANWLQMESARRSPRAEHIRTPLSTGGPDTDIRLAKSIGDVRLPEREWNALVSGAETNSIFQTHQWMQSWLDVYDHLHDPFFLVADVGGVPAAVAPLMVNKITKRQDRVLTFIGSGRADYCDFIVPRTGPAILVSLVKALLDRSDWDMIDLSNIPATSSTVEAFRLACQDRKLPFGVFEQYPCPSLIIEGRESEAQEVSTNRACVVARKSSRRPGSSSNGTCSPRARSSPDCLSFSISTLRGGETVVLRASSWMTATGASIAS